jgi:hypothetical protein
MVIRGLVMESDLLTLLSPDQIAVELEAGMLEQIDCDLPLGLRTIGLTTRQDWLPTTAQRQLIGMLRDAAKATRLHKNQ